MYQQDLCQAESGVERIGVLEVQLIDLRQGHGAWLVAAKDCDGQVEVVPDAILLDWGGAVVKKRLQWAILVGVGIAEEDLEWWDLSSTRTDRDRVSKAWVGRWMRQDAY